jgi:hypothetical protein
LVPESRRNALIVSVLTGVSNIVVGTSVFLEAEGTLIKVVAVFIVLLGAIHSVELASIGAWRHRNVKELDQGLFDDPVRVKKKHTDGYINRSARRNLSKAMAAERHTSTVHEVQSASDPLSRQAFFFCAGLLVGVLGTAVAVSGLIANIYPATLAGSIIASIGFVTLACALVSAEAASETA